MSRAHQLLRIAMGTLAVLIVGLALWRVYRQPPTRANVGTVDIDYGRVAEFSFTNQNDRPFGRADLSGHWWIGDFIFTRCMGPCPLITTQMARLQSEFANAKNLRFVSFSVDPDYDKPAMLKKYAATYGADEARWYFLTGPKAALYDLIRKSFKLAVETRNSTGKPDDNEILHSVHMVLVDPDGRIRGYFDSTDQTAMTALRQRLNALPE